MNKIDGNKVLIDSLKERIVRLEIENERLRSLLSIGSISDVK